MFTVNQSIAAVDTLSQPGRYNSQKFDDVIELANEE